MPAGMRMTAVAMSSPLCSPLPLVRPAQWPWGAPLLPFAQTLTVMRQRAPAQGTFPQQERPASPCHPHK